jgi:hypothetical protein
MIISEYKDNIRLHLIPSVLTEDKGTSVTQKKMPSQSEQYGSTVHLLIGKGRSLCKITPMPFTFANDSIVIHRGLIAFSLLSQIPFLLSCRSSLAHSFGSASTFVFFALLTL